MPPHWACESVAAVSSVAGVASAKIIGAPIRPLSVDAFVVPYLTSSGLTMTTKNDQESAATRISSGPLRSVAGATAPVAAAEAKPSQAARSSPVEQQQRARKGENATGNHRPSQRLAEHEGGEHGDHRRLGADDDAGEARARRLVAVDVGDVVAEDAGRSRCQEARPVLPVEVPGPHRGEQDHEQRRRDRIANDQHLARIDRQHERAREHRHDAPR